MRKLERSLDIALSTEPAEPYRREVSVVPLTSTESLVAVRGLALHLDVLYKGVRKRAGDDRALLEVFNFLSADMDNIRRRSYDLMVILNPDGPDLDPTRTAAARALASIVYGRRTHETGVWRKGGSKDREIEDMAAELKDINLLDFFEMRQQGFEQARDNLTFWRYQLEDVRSDPYIGRLRTAIEESDHYPEEV